MLRALQSQGSATATGYGEHPRDSADNVMPRFPVLKLNSGWPWRASNGIPCKHNLIKSQGLGEQGSLINDFDRKKSEQKSAREEIMVEMMG